MKNKLVIGIPRSFLYYRYGILWKNFFKKLNCKVIISSETTKKTLEDGKNLSIDESCLSSKIYMGHIKNLENKCDYILIPRIGDYGKNNGVCTKFNGIYDVVKNSFPLINILDYNIENSKLKFEFFGFFRMGLKITKNIFKILYSYIYSKKKQKEYDIEQENKQINILKSKNKKLLIVSHPYNVYDNLIGVPIIKYLKENNFEIIYANLYNRKKAILQYKSLSKTLYWLYSKELVGAINYYKDKVDGIIFITTFPCGPDSLVNELMIRKLKNIPILNLLIDEATSETGLITRLESFIDIINFKGDNNG